MVMDNFYWKASSDGRASAQGGSGRKKTDGLLLQVNINSANTSVKGLTITGEHQNGKNYLRVFDSVSMKLLHEIITER